ncbi:MAG: hypothetical protein AAGE84_27425 [Cyanobacteria bacterium P01_G01_bin.39]
MIIKTIQIAIATATVLFSSMVQAQVRNIELDRDGVRDDPKTYCTPIPGQAVYQGTVVTVPVGHDCSSWLNYLLQQEITEKNLELRREEFGINAKLQLYLNTAPRW